MPAVPVLFLLPPWLVPVTMAAAIVLARVPEVVRGNVVPGRLLLAPANAWFTVGPAAVLALAGSPSAAEAGVLILVAMLTAQIGTDFAVSVLWQRLTSFAPLAVQIREAFMVYLLDALLFPVGLLAALAIDHSPYYVALMVPLFAVLAVFASERRVRLEQRRKIEFGALLHDVGKVAIPNEIINKPGPLDDEEWVIMRTHTVEGQRMLDRVGGAMSEVGEIVRGSHERWDGGGYPDGLKGEAIPLEARIICACDAYNAMTTTRSYREAAAPAAAAAELVRCAGTQFDPAVVDALLSVIGVVPAAAPADEQLAA